MVTFSPEIDVAGKKQVTDIVGINLARLIKEQVIFEIY